MKKIIKIVNIKFKDVYDKIWIYVFFKIQKHRKTSVIIDAEWNNQNVHIAMYVPT